MIKFDNEIRIVIFSSLFAETRKFYEEILKLTILKEWNHGEGRLGVVYQLDSAQLEILQKSENIITDDFYIYLKVKNINELWEDLRLKAIVVNPLKVQPWNHKNFSIKDPNGYTLKFFSEV